MPKKMSHYWTRHHSYSEDCVWCYTDSKIQDIRTQLLQEDPEFMAAMATLMNSVRREA